MDYTIVKCTEELFQKYLRRCLRDSPAFTRLHRYKTFLRNLDKPTDIYLLLVGEILAGANSLDEVTRLAWSGLQNTADTTSTITWPGKSGGTYTATITKRRNSRK